jgi:hypothetical protein
VIYEDLKDKTEELVNVEEDDSPGKEYLRHPIKAKSSVVEQSFH